MNDRSNEHRNDTTQTLEELVHGGDIAMLTTRSSNGELTSRPLTVARVAAGSLFFLIDATAEWVTEMHADYDVNVAVSNGGRNDWVSVSGSPTLTADSAAIAELWSPAASAYFDSAEDPRLRSLQVHMESGQYWSAPGGGPLGRLLSVLGMAIGAEPLEGMHGEVSPRPSAG